MKERLRRNIWFRVVPAAALGMALSLGGCKKDDDPMPGPGPGPGPGGGEGSNFTAGAASTSGNYARPLDSVPSSDGSTIYFTAMNEKGYGVFKVAATGGAVSEVFVGAPFVAPLGITISGDDKTLFVADGMAGHDASAEDPRPPGLILRLPASGGMPGAIDGTAGTRARSLDLATEGGAEVIYFTGNTPDTGEPAVLRIGTAGGAPTTVFKGAPLTDPSGIAVAQGGDIYVANTASATSGQASVIKISGGRASELVGNLVAGYPAGLAINMDGSRLLLSGRHPDLGTTVVYRIDVAKGEVVIHNQGIENNTDAGGVHRARKANVYSWAGVTAGTGGQGLVYRVEFK